MITFGTQSELWLQALSQRKRGTVKPASIGTFKSCLKRLNAIVGTTNLADVHNGTARHVVEQFIQDDLSPATINLMLTILKAVVASHVDQATGEPVYPRIWKSSFIDAPRITDQNQPTYSREEIEAILAGAPSDTARMLIAFCAGTGMRIGEILDCRINSKTETSLDLAGAVVHVRTSRYLNQSQLPKTASAVRPVDLCPELVAMLQKFVGDRRDGFLFTARGGPLQVATLRKQLSGIGAAQFHAYRRFRATHLRASLMPDQLVKLYLGHAGTSVTDRYSKIAERLDVRKEWTQRCGLGFEIPTQLYYEAPPHPVRHDTLQLETT